MGSSAIIRATLAELLLNSSVLRDFCGKALECGSGIVYNGVRMIM